MKPRHLNHFDVNSVEFIRSSLTTFTNRTDEAVHNIHHNDQAIHDFRIALRCLRSWLKAFGNTIGLDPELLADASRLATATNHCRDLEVYATWLDHQIDCGIESQPIDNYVNHIHQCHEQAKQDIRIYISDTWPEIGCRIHKAIHHPDHIESVGTELSHMLYQALHKQLLKLSCQFTEVAGAEEGEHSAKLLHKCRITIKQIRYLLDPFKTENVQCKKLVQDLKSVQDQLGVYHDLWIFTATLYQDASKHDGLYTLIELIERQRHEGFSTLQRNLLVLPVPWLKSLEAILTMIAGRENESSSPGANPSFVRTIHE